MQQPWYSFIKSFWYAPWFIAMPVALFVIFFLPDVFRKYTLEIEHNGPVNKSNGYEYYDDLDGDGNSEQIVLFNDTEGKAAVKIIDHKGFIVDHYYFSGKIVPQSGSLTIDTYDSTGVRGIFLITKSNDSILLHGIAPANIDKTLFRDQLLTVLTAGNAENDYTINFLSLVDVNREGDKEVVTGVMAGFQAQPRNLFLYNIRSRQLINSHTALVLQSITDTADLDGNGLPEFITSTYSIDNNNHRYNFPLNDDSAWLIVYNRNLEFFFPPVGFPGKYIELMTVVTRRFGNPYLFVLHEPRAKGIGIPKLILFNTTGQYLRERILSSDTLRGSFEIFRSDELAGRIFLVCEGGVLEEIDTNLQVVGRKVIKGAVAPSVNVMDIDGDGRKECRFWGAEYASIIVTEADFSHPVSMNNPFGTTELHFQVIREKGKRARWYIQGGNKRIICSYEKNLLYYFKYPAYLSVYFVILGFVLVVQYLQRRRTRQLIDASRKISEMQLLLLNDQLDPHFTFNAINSISASILDEKPEEANRNLLSLSRLMRSFVQHHEKLSRTLAEELDFLQNYLVLMHTRLNATFIYQFDVGEEVDLNIQVPKMITQIFVENSIKHGLKPLSRGGELKVVIQQQGETLLIEIRDNGIGRKEAGRSGEPGAGKGTTIIDQSLKIINNYNHKKISYRVNDLYDNHANPAGTQVSITIPLGINYNFTKP